MNDVSPTPTPEAPPAGRADGRTTSTGEHAARSRSARGLFERRFLERRFFEGGLFERGFFERGFESLAMRLAPERGIALLMVIVCLAFFLAVAASLVLMASMETRMAGAERARHAARGAAEVALERALQELAIAADLNEILAGSVRSGVGGANLSPEVGEWGVLDLAALTDSLQRETTAANAWGADGQTWRLFGYAPLDDLLDAAGAGASGAAAGAGAGAGAGGAADSQFYTIAWVADDPGDGDGNPSADANGRLTVRVEAFGPFRSRQALTATVRRQGGSLELISWREQA